MLKNPIRICCLGCVLVASGALIAQVEPSTLKPVNVIRLDPPNSTRSHPTMAMQALVASGQQLYLLATPAGSASARPQSVIITNVQSSKVTSFEIPGAHVDTRWLAVDGAGLIWVLSPKRDSAGKVTHLWRAFDTQGRQQREISSSEPVTAARILNGQMIYTTASKHLRSIDLSTLEDRVSSALDDSVVTTGPIFLEEASGQKLFIANGSTRHVQWGTADSPAARTRLSSPELDQAALQNTPGLVFLCGFASDRAGRIYAALGNYRLADGAPVEVFDETAKLIRELRLSLPQDSRWSNPDNPDGYMHVFSIAVEGRDLYALDSIGIVIHYALPQ